MSDMVSVHVFVMKNKLDNVELMINDRHAAALCVLQPSTRFLHGSHVMLTGRHPRTIVRFLHKRKGADWESFCGETWLEPVIHKQHAIAGGGGLVAH